MFSHVTMWTPPDQLINKTSQSDPDEACTSPGFCWCFQQASPATICRPGSCHVHFGSQVAAEISKKKKKWIHFRGMRDVLLPIPANRVQPGPAAHLSETNNYMHSPVGNLEWPINPVNQTDCLCTVEGMLTLIQNVTEHKRSTNREALIHCLL